MVFFMIRLIPGDPALVLLGEGADAASLAAVRAEMGLDQPLPAQFLTWLAHALRGDLGTSIATGEPASGVASVTVWRRSGREADIASTSSFVAVSRGNAVSEPAFVIKEREGTLIAEGRTRDLRG